MNQTQHGTPGTAPIVDPTSGRLRPVGTDQVKITAGFWAERQTINSGATLDHIEHWLEREGWLPNFDLAAAGALPDGRRGREFSDSEVYKFVEAMAWEIGRTGDPNLEARFVSIVSRIAAAQSPDGYLNTAFGRPGQQPRWSDLQWGHELYCFGHLIQAAVARARTRPNGDDQLFEVASRSADLVCEVFGVGGIESVGGHPEIEPALVELARFTGQSKYLEQARLFVERRGRGTLPTIEFGQQYFQDDVPIREATVLRGHAVRANYLSAGAVDVGVETGDAELMDALELQWANTVARRTYITGGQGSYHLDESFGDDWVLPADRSYSETCAGVGSIMYSWRLLLARGDVKFADLIERTLYNVVATSPSQDGTAFYYANTLHQRKPGTLPPPDEASHRAESSLRAPWFDVSCCPPNVARTLASLSGYLATTDDDGVQILQYASCTIDATLGDGRSVALVVDTDYPSDGSIRIRPTSTSTTPWTLTVRVPSWATGASLVTTFDGERQAAPVEPGFVSVSRAFIEDDLVELTLPMEPRVVRADRRVDAVRGCVAVERGPEVLCLESTDLVAASSGTVTDVGDVYIEPGNVNVDGATVTVQLKGLADAPAATKTDEDPEVGQAKAWPYQTSASEPEDVAAIESVLIPYHRWAQRGPSTMRIWIPTPPVSSKE